MSTAIYISDEEDDVSFMGAKTHQSLRHTAVAIDLASSDSEVVVDIVRSSIAGPSRDRKGKNKSSAIVGLLDTIDSLEPLEEVTDNFGAVDPPVKRRKTSAKDPMSREDKDVAKEAEKARKQLEKDTAKAAKEAEKSFQRKVSEANRLRTSKDATVREIQLYLSADLALPSSPIAGALPEIRHRLTDNISELHFLPDADSPIPNTVRFKRHVQSRYSHERKAWQPIDKPYWEWEPAVLVVLTATELTDKIASDGLRAWVGDVKLALQLPIGSQIIVMIKGLQKYYSKAKSQANKEYTAAARAGLGGSSSAHISNRQPPREEIEAELVRLQVAEGCFLVHVEKTEDIEDWIFNLAGDVAIRPYKLLSKSHLAFCATDGVKKGHTPGDTFELMLQEVQGITQSAAAGIAAEFPSFKDLMNAYEQQERRGGGRAEIMLQDCEVKNLRSGVANGRKVKTALSTRVFNVFRGEDSLALV